MVSRDVTEVMRKGESCLQFLFSIQVTQDNGLYMHIFSFHQCHVERVVATVFCTISIYDSQFLGGEI